MRDPSATPILRGLTFVTLAAIAWGTGGVIAAVLYRTSGLGPIALSFWRTAIGVALLAAVQVRRRPARTTRLRWAVVLVTGAGLALYQTAYYVAVARSGVAFATVVTLGAGPVLIAVMARLAIAERLGAAGVAAVAVAPLGLLLVVGGASSGSLGLLFSLVSAAGYAGVTVLQRAVGGGDPARTTLSGFVVAMVFLAPFAAWEGFWPTRDVSWQTVGLVLYLGAVSTALAYSLFFASLAVVRATTVSIVALVEPLSATAIAVTLLGERLTWPMGVGSAVLLGAVALLARAEVRVSPSAAPGR